MNSKLKAAGFFTLGVIAVMVGVQVVSGLSIPVLNTIAKKATGKA